jgi:hypothetical protein
LSTKNELPVKRELLCFISMPYRVLTEIIFMLESQTIF